MQELNNGIIPLAPLLAKLGVMLTASLFVERFLAVISWFIDRLVVVQVASDWEVAKHMKVKLKTDEQTEEEAKILMDSTDDPGDDPREIEPHPRQKDIQPDSRFDVKEILPPEYITDPDERFRVMKDRNRIRKEFWMQLLGTLVAIGGCWYMKFSIWDFVTKGNGPQLWEFILTGIIIGAGSKPVNFLMKFLIHRKIEVSRESIREEEMKKTKEVPPAPKLGIIERGPVTAPAIAPPVNTIEHILGFLYDGGDRPERLENTHRFTSPIDLIVYHHTAMHSDSPFRELVKEFDRKGWLTGYHCVIMNDGTIRVLCRWDRFGNHAKGNNAHSMGIAFQGNYETNPNVPFSNHDGRYGIQYPTSAQLDSAARIVALWALLYSVEIRFPEKDDAHLSRGIVPHMNLAQKACPGCNFPHKNFQERIKHYATFWKQEEDFQGALNEFKTTPMVMA